MVNTRLVYALSVFKLWHLVSPQNCCKSTGTFSKSLTSHSLFSLFIMCHIAVLKCSVFIFFIMLFFFFLNSQITLWQIGYTPAPRGRSDALTQSTRLSNWKRSSCLICISLETAGSRSQGSWIWPRGRSKSGFRTGGWRWRKWTKKRPTAKNNNNVDCSQKTHHNNH